MIFGNRACQRSIFVTVKSSASCYRFLTLMHKYFDNIQSQCYNYQYNMHNYRKTKDKNAQIQQKVGLGIL